MRFEIKELIDIPKPKELWSEVVGSTSYAWVWSTYSYHNFAISYLQSLGRLVEDRSFFIYQNGQLCGLVILVFSRADEFDGIQASYSSSPLPWPMTMDHVEDRESLESFMFDELENRVKAVDASKVQLCLNAPEERAEWESRYINVIRKYGFVDNSFLSHLINITPETHGKVRKRYKRYVKKFQDKYELRIIDQRSYYSKVPNEYMTLHVKDAGAVYRPIETYKAQLEAISGGDGFAVQAINKSNDELVGMLLILCNKNAAYDASVAVDPDYQEEYISHLMKWKAIQYLQHLGITHYELGQAAIVPDYLWQPEGKNYGITNFKDGWARGNRKNIYVAEKYYDVEALVQAWEKKLANIKKYFKLP